MEPTLLHVGVYLFLIKNKKLLYLHKPNDPIWTCLGGRMSEDEIFPTETLSRESIEEIGTNDLDIKDIFDIRVWSNGKSKRLGIFYYGYLKDENFKIKLSEEHDKYNFFTYGQAKVMLSQEERGKVGIELINKLPQLNLIN